MTGLRLENDMTTRTWMDANLATQGYCLTKTESRELAVGLRFATGVCLTLVITALVIGSPIIFAGLALIGLAAGFGRRHPFDYVWNGVVRHVLHAPALPPSPTRRRHAFKVATAMLLVVAGLLAVGATTAALVVGVMLVAACTAVTAINFCVPSVLISLVDRRAPAGMPVAAGPASAPGGDAQP